jgi:tetratricopeptide (TPR) repeat protein
MELLGDYATLEGSAEIAFNTAQEEARSNPQDPHAWFNMGSSLVGMQQYEAAGRAFDRAFDIGVPWRILWYQFGPYEAYFENGRYQDILDLVNANLQNGGDKVEETYYWQGRVLAELGRIPEARTAFNRALGRNRLFEPARQALDSL